MTTPESVAVYIGTRGAGFSHRLHGGVVVVEDLCLPDRLSVTTDAPRVVQKLREVGYDLAVCPVVYRDSVGVWDQILVWSAGSQDSIGFKILKCRNVEDAIEVVWAGHDPASPSVEPAASPTLVKPLVHLYGTSRGELLLGYYNAKQGVEEAMRLVALMAPHARDYYYLPQVNGQEATLVAGDQHRRRLALLQAVKDELEELALHCQESRSGDAEEQSS